jgi:hypothetical protein
MERHCGDAFEKSPVVIVEPCQSGGGLRDGLSDATGGPAGRGGDEDLVGRQGRIDAMSDGQQHGRCGGFAGARPSGEHSHPRVHEGGDGQALLGVVEVGLDRAGFRSGDPLWWQDLPEMAGHLGIGQSRTLRP